MSRALTVGSLEFSPATSKIIRDTFNNAFSVNKQSLWRGEISPSTDILDDGKYITLECEVAGIPPENIKIFVENGVLHIQGEKIQNKTVENNKVVRSERTYGRFSRTFNIPDIFSDNIKAEYEHGILKVILERKEPKKPKEVKINVLNR